MTPETAALIEEAKALSDAWVGVRDPADWTMLDRLVAALQDSGNGICGDRAPGMRGIPTEVCVLRAGHSGWHQAAPPPDAPRHPAMWNDPRPVPEGSTEQ